MLICYPKCSRTLYLPYIGTRAPAPFAASRTCRAPPRRGTTRAPNRGMASGAPCASICCRAPLVLMAASVLMKLAVPFAAATAGNEERQTYSCAGRFFFGGVLATKHVLSRTLSPTNMAPDRGRAISRYPHGCHVSGRVHAVGLIESGCISLFVFWRQDLLIWDVSFLLPVRWHHLCKRRTSLRGTCLGTCDWKTQSKQSLQQKFAAFGTLGDQSCTL